MPEYHTIAASILEIAPHINVFTFSSRSLPTRMDGSDLEMGSRSLCNTCMLAMSATISVSAKSNTVATCVSDIGSATLIDTSLAYGHPCRL